MLCKSDKPCIIITSIRSTVFSPLLSCVLVCLFSIFFLLLSYMTTVHWHPRTPHLQVLDFRVVSDYVSYQLCANAQPGRSITNTAMTGKAMLLFEIMLSQSSSKGEGRCGRGNSLRQFQFLGVSNNNNNNRRLVTLRSEWPFIILIFNRA